jgi:hypothetical protein
MRDFNQLTGKSRSGTQPEADLMLREIWFHKFRFAL